MKDFKEQFRIGTLAQQLGVKRFVIRFWEKEFGITASRSNGGQRFYAKKDFERFRHIKELLYEKGFTIAGAKKILTNTTHYTPATYSLKSAEKKIDASHKQINVFSEHLKKQLINLQRQLIKFRNLL